MSATQADGALSVGIIGAGNVVRDMHLPVLAATTGATTTWITDRDRKLNLAVARAYGLRAIDLPDRARDLPNAAVYLLAIPYGAREPYYEALRDRQAALYVEKPLALDTDEHRRLCSGFEECRIGVGFQRRSFGPTLRVRELIAEGLFGELVSVHFEMGRPGGGRYSGFRSDTKQSGGGILFEHGVHLLDSVLFMTEATSVRVRTVKMVFECNLDVHTEAAFVVGRERGPDIECSLKFSWLTETEPGVVLEFERAQVSYSIYDELGRIQFRGPSGSNLWRILPDSGGLYPLTLAQTLHEHWRLFLDGVRSAQPNYTAAARSLLTTEVVQNCYQFGRSSAGYAVEPS